MSTPTPPWTFDETQVTFDNPGYKWDGSVPSTPPPPSEVLPGPIPLYGGDRVIYDSLTAGEQIILPTDFISKLQQGETVNSATTTITVYSGSDSNPSAMLLGVPVVSGTVVNTKVGGGVVGVIYQIKVTALTSLLQSITLLGYLAVVSDLV